MLLKFAMKNRIQFDPLWLRDNNKLDLKGFKTAYAMST